MRILTSLFLLVSILSGAQNTVEWKKRKPFADYWQQDVAYKIKAEIKERKLQIEGDLELKYTNNSPDTLLEVYFHLYQNAFQENSHYDNLLKENGQNPWYGLYEKNGLGTTVDSIKTDKGIDSLIYDNTILKVQLTKPILPNETINFDIKFTTYWGNGSNRRRMKAYYVENNFVHFNGVHWYPRISVYDRKFGWTTEQHLDKEFYGDFGTFDVELSFPDDYIVEATGTLTNEAQVLPDSLKKKLHISNYYHRGSEEDGDTLSIITQRKFRKVWKYYAENVHDFAFTADPTYRLDEAVWNGIRCISVVEERHCPKWKTAAKFAAEVIKVYSEDFGMYAYPKMVVADARDGMEYPMLTLNSGKSPHYRGLIAHEIGHNWFYGMLGSNETYRAMMDEGFTQFLTAWSLMKIDGEIYKPYQKDFNNAFLNKYQHRLKTLDIRAYLGYLNAAVEREDPTLNTHSSDFSGGAIRHGGGYGQVYTKTAVMLYNLQYVLGDSLFLSAMQHYVNKWKFAHPYPNDFRTSIIEHVGTDLNWFFDQWMETSKVIDYSVGKVKHLKNDTFLIQFERKGEMQMPIDFEVLTYTGDKIKYHIPNTWFVKKTDAKVLPKWWGWGNLNPSYEAKVVIKGGIKDVIIDPSKRLADINPLNNSKSFPYSISFYPEFNNAAKRNEYEILGRPDLWWNRYDGLKAGIRYRGSYLHKKHKIDAAFWFNSGLGQSKHDTTVRIGKFDQISYRFKFNTILPNISKKLSIDLLASQLAGLHKYHMKLAKRSKDNKHSFSIGVKSIFRSSSNHFTYALYKDEWNLRQANNSLNFEYSKKYSSKKGKGITNINYRSSGFFSDYDYDYITFENKFNFKMKKFRFKTRFFLFGGAGKKWAPESMLFLAGANPEVISDNKFTRAEGVFSERNSKIGDNINTFHAGGGLNLRGYAGYLAPEKIGDNQYSTYKGTNGASINIEIEFENYLGLNTLFWKKHLTFKTYAFADAGVIDVYEAKENFVFKAPRADAGLGVALTIKKFYRLNAVKPFTIRADFPVFLNRVPNIDPEYINYRWIIGINRAF